MQTTHQNEFLNQILRTEVLLSRKPLCVDIYLNCLQTHWILQPEFSFLGEVFHSCTHNPEHKIRSVFLSFVQFILWQLDFTTDLIVQRQLFPYFPFPFLVCDWWTKMRNPSQNITQKFKKPSSSNACLAITETCPLFLLFTNIKSSKFFNLATSYRDTLHSATASFASR